MLLHRDETGRIIRTREKWWEWLWVQMPDVRRTIDATQLAPRFFLPVGQERLSGRIDCWILPLAPFAMVFSLLNHAFKSVWFDLVELNLILEEWVMQKRK